MTLRLVTATIEVDGTEYTEEIQDFSYDPTAVVVEVTDVGGKVHKLSGESGYTLTLNVFQNFVASGFARKCFDDEGEEAIITIVDGPVTWESVISLVAPKIGGATKQVGVSTMAFPSSRPVPTATV